MIAEPSEVFETHRPRLLGLAYRMLGSMTEAEDVVQEAWLRWHRAVGIEQPEAWLVRVTSRIALDQLRSAARRRETYVGPWLPEPVADESPTDSVELADSLSLALLAVLERLSPAERAAFLLREVFDYDYSQLAEILDKNQASCRQLVHRAKARLTTERPRFDVSKQQQQEMVDRFVSAANQGELGPLEQMLDQQVVLWSDGGGKVLAALNPIDGIDKVGRFFRGIWPKQPPGTHFESKILNGEPAILVTVEGKVLQTVHFDIGCEGKVLGIYIVRNPDKLNFV